ncbi:MAG: valine--tRNA ligase [Bauldia sp.]|nr:valine--tRNA ligase [Bauldia sp.]
MLEKTYDAAAIEPRIAAEWERAGAFKAGAGAKPDAPSFSVVIPPPNVTGSLHMGHALNNTLQDILVRYHRMKGDAVLWQPGTDHAGIATQMVVERQLMERQQPGRRAMGREKFLETVWKWRDESGGTIIRQLKRLGASCDWSRERFTLGRTESDQMSRAVIKAFVDLHRDGLIYRDKRLVNWDPKLQTAISDLEVQQVEVKGSLWHFRYPIEGEEGRFIVVATTRPETMLGDTAVAVNPEDERYADFVAAHRAGKPVMVRLPLVGRLIPIVADEYPDPEAGSGAVKITPAHDFNDFEVGRRHNLPKINLYDAESNLVLRANPDFLAGLAPTPELEATIAALDGMDRFNARKRVVAMLEERGLIEKIEPYTHTVPHGDRSAVPIEPFLTDQWYVDAKKMAVPALAAVRDGTTQFVPRNWEKTYFDWMENIQPWCISRQLWWGHQIPAWYGPDGKAFVATEAAEAERAAAQHYGKPTALKRDEDVLDTWFSSGLWPFSTLGWPDETPELARYYPTATLVTGFDIIFFWVARMMMMGLHFMGEAPFSEVYIHGIVRDERGAKMSKTKGNVVDPLDLIDEYGADALRFTMASLATPGRDVKPARARIEGYRNFATKLWQASRFCELNECPVGVPFEPETAKETVNRWILTEANRAVAAVEAAIGAFRFDEAAGTAYRFVWNTYCDWYLELIKPTLGGPEGEAKTETRRTAGWVLGEILRLLHPFMPFITEEIWAKLPPASARPLPLLAISPWPDSGFEDRAAAAEINWLIRLVEEVRSVRAETNIPAGAQIPVVVSDASAETRERLARHQAAIARLARVNEVQLAKSAPSGSAQIVIGEAIVSIPLAGLIDLGAERARLAKETDRLTKEIGKLDAKLGNPEFVAKAPEEVVEEQRERREDAALRIDRMQAALARLPSS